MTFISKLLFSHFEKKLENRFWGIEFFPYKVHFKFWTCGSKTEFEGISYINIFLKTLESLV